MTVGDLVRGRSEHSDRPDTVSKRRCGDIFSIRMRCSRVADGVVFAALAIGLIIRPSITEARPPRGDADGRSASGRPSRDLRRLRYVSAQAYHHALRGELALKRQDWSTANDEFQLAIVYDPTSLYLHTQLVRLQWQQGHVAQARRYLGRARQLTAGRVGSSSADVAEGRATLLRLQAEIARVEGRLSEAERCLRQAWRLQPDDLAAPLALADVLVQSDRLAAALRLFRALSARHPTGARPLVAAARHLKSRGRWSEAADQWAEAARRADLSASDVAELADTYERLGQPASAHRVWLRFLTRQSSTRSALDRDLQAARLAAARLAFAQGQWDVGEELLDSALARDAGARVDRVYFSEGLYERALAAILRRESGDEPDPERTLLSARSLARLGRHREALTRLTRLPAGDRLDWAARWLVIAVHARQGRRSEALNLLRSELGRSSLDARFVLAFVKLSIAEGRARAAFDASRTARRADPENTGLWSAELLALEALGDRFELGAFFAIAELALAPAEVARLRAERAVRTVRTDSDSTLEAVERWLALRPRNLQALLMRAELARNDPQERFGLSFAKRALSEAPQNPKAIAAIGWVDHCEGRQSRALEHLRRAARLDPWDARVAKRWAEVALAAGHPMEAKDAYRRAERARMADLRSMTVASSLEVQRVRRKPGEPRSEQ